MEITLEDLVNVSEFLKNILQIFFWIAVGGGFFLLFVYSILLGYIPRSISTGETIYLILIFFSAVVGYSALIVVLWLTTPVTSFIVRQLRKLNLIFWNKLGLNFRKFLFRTPYIAVDWSVLISSFLFSFLYLALAFAPYYLEGNSLLTLRLLLMAGFFHFGYFLVANLLDLKGWDKDSLFSTTNISIISLILFTIFSPLIVGKIGDSLINSSMKRIGIRTGVRKIIFSEEACENYSILSQKAKKGKSKCYLEGEILFRGFGENTLIRCALTQFCSQIGWETRVPPVR